MAVIVGSARIDENGNAYGGAAGDQTGKEVGTQNWYKHAKGWVCIRPKDEKQAALIAKAMKAACDSPNIGYDQWQRNSLYAAVEPFGFDIAKLTEKKETDCSALVRVCCAFAGIHIAEAFRTTTQATVMMKTGAFELLTDAKYTERSDYLKVGDILVTKTQGHTVVVLTNGPKAGTSTPTVPVTPVTGNPYSEPSTMLKYGSKGNGVKWLQYELTNKGFPCDGIDGDFGQNTLTAVKKFQTEAKVEVDGKVGPQTRTALKSYTQTKAKSVLITGSSVNVRAKSDTTGAILGVVKKGEKLPYTGADSNGWHGVTYKNQAAWISGTYSEVVE